MDLPACFLNRASPFTTATAATPSAVHPVSSRSFSFRAFSCFSRSDFAFLIASYSAKIAFASVAVRSTTCSVVLTVVLVVRTVVLTVDVLMVVSFCRFGQTAGWPLVSSQLAALTACYYFIIHPDLPKPCNFANFIATNWQQLLARLSGPGAGQGLGRRLADGLGYLRRDAV
jgi:hypothetical protein